MARPDAPPPMQPLEEMSSPVDRPDAPPPMQPLPLAEKGMFGIIFAQLILSVS